jgi:hypothetical protein
MVVVPVGDEEVTVRTAVAGVRAVPPGTGAGRPQSTVATVPIVCTLHERTTRTETWRPAVRGSACAGAPPVTRPIERPHASHLERIIVAPRMLSAPPAAIKTLRYGPTGRERIDNASVESMLQDAGAICLASRVVQFSVSACTNALMHLMHPVAPDAPCRS